MRKVSFFLLISLSYLTSLAQNQQEIYRFTTDILSDTSNAEEASVSFSFIGDHKRAAHFYSRTDSLFRPITKQDSLLFKDYKPVEAVKYLAEKAHNARVIFINEARHMPQHRMFAASLLEDLHDLGFRYLALDALYSDESLINTRKYPAVSSGYYCSEPQYGELMRQASRIGYTLLSYESYADDNNAMTDSTGTIRLEIGKNNHELSRARNLRRILLKDPQAKIIVYTSDAKLYADSAAGGMKPVASYFQDLTGMQPLLIDQVRMQEKENPSHEDPFYRLAAPERSAVYVNKMQQPFSGNAVYIFHPVTKYLYMRPEWMFRGKRKPLILKESDIAIDCPCMVSAFYESEDPNLAVPADVIELSTKTTQKALALKPGDYLLLLRNQRTAGSQLRIRVK